MIALVSEYSELNIEYGVYFRKTGAKIFRWWHWLSLEVDEGTEIFHTSKVQVKDSYFALYFTLRQPGEKKSLSV